MQIIKISHLTKVAIKTRTSRFFHRNLSGSPDIRTEIHKKNAQLPQKTREFLRKTREESKESPLVFHPTLRHREEHPHSFKKTRLLKTKTLRSATDAPLPSPISHHTAVSRQRKSFGFSPMTRRKRSLIDDQRRSCHLPNIPWCIQHLAASNRHTVSQSVQPWSFPFISTTLCAKCSKRNSYFCPNRIYVFRSSSNGLCRHFRPLPPNVKGEPRHTTTV